MIDYTKDLKLTTLGMGMMWILVGGVLTALALSVSLIVATTLAIVAPDDSFRQAVWVEVAAGIATFMMIPLFVRLGAFYKWQTPLCGMSVSLVVGIWANNSSGLLQSFLIELSAGILLLVALELGVNAWIKALVNAWKHMIESAEKVEEGY